MNSKPGCRTRWRRSCSASNDHRRRIQVTKTSDGKINYPLYGLEGKLLLEDNRQTLTRTEYIYAGGRLIAKRIQPITATGANNGTATVTTIHADFLGSPVAETNSAGTVTRVERYTPYGEPSDMQLDAGPGFTGHATDIQTGLTYMQQRYYDAEIARFISPDPVQTDSNSGGNMNRYWYADNNPVSNVDPDGRNPTMYSIHSSKGALPYQSHVNEAIKSLGNPINAIISKQEADKQDLSDHADDDRDITTKEGMAYYNVGGGRTLIQDASKLTVMYYRTSPDEYRAWVAGKEYWVHGQVSMDFKNSQIMTGPYDFEMHDGYNPIAVLRNAGTQVGKLIAGPGQPYYIIYIGNPKIIEVPSPQRILGEVEYEN